MTIPRDKMLKISVFVEDEEVGGKFIKPRQYDQVSRLVDIINNNQIDRIIMLNENTEIPEIGSIFDQNSNTFINTENPPTRTTSTNQKAFCFVSNSVLEFVDVFSSPDHDNFIAAYQSNPTFQIEEVPIGQFR